MPVDAPAAGRVAVLDVLMISLAYQEDAWCLRYVLDVRHSLQTLARLIKKYPLVEEPALDMMKHWIYGVMYGTL